MADVRVLLDEVKLWYRPISDKAFRSSILFGSQTKGKRFKYTVCLCNFTESSLSA